MDPKTDPTISDNPLESFTYISEIYNQAESYNKKSSSPNLHPLFNTQKKQNKHINLPIFQNLDKLSRVKVIQLACESPNVVTMFQKNKLFVKGIRSSKYLIPENLDHFHFGPKKKLEKKNFAPDPKLELELVKNDFKARILKIRQDNERNEPLRNSSCRKNMCSVLRNITKQCDISSELNASEHIATSQKPPRKFIRNWTERLNWTANKLQQLSHYNKPVIKELFSHELDTKHLEKLDAYTLNKELLNRSSKTLKSQLYTFKKMLIKKKLKIL